jgi:DNA-binding transcriptional LysR family regulator
MPQDYQLGKLTLCNKAIANDIRSGKLVRLLPDYEVQGNLGNSLYAIYPAGRSYTPKVRVFVEYLQARWAGETGVPWAL